MHILEEADSSALKTEVRNETSYPKFVRFHYMQKEPLIKVFLKFYFHENNII
jgi:hypothetical protein